MESDIQDINRNLIALPEDEVRRNNRILHDVVFDQLIPRMKQKDQLFKRLYRNPSYAGSFFCGLKVGHPDEYDLDFLMKLPDDLEPTVTLCNTPGFLQIQLKGMQKWAPTQQWLISQYNTMRQRTSRRRRPNYETRVHERSRKMQNLWDHIKYNLDLPLSNQEQVILCGLANLLDDDYYLDATQVSRWIESIIIKTYRDFDTDRSGRFADIETSEGTLTAVLPTKNGPAFTLKLRTKSNPNPLKIDIDLVPGFVFSREQWPCHPFRQNPTPDKDEFFTVPKKPKNHNLGRYWRPSFQVQESVLINDKQNLKPCIRLLKRLRDVCNDTSIASYYIKTIFLWELKNSRSLWDKPLMDVFMAMLEKCEVTFRNGEILNYWNPRDNLIEDLNPTTLENIANKFRRIIAVLKEDPGRIGEYFVG